MIVEGGLLREPTEVAAFMRRYRDALDKTQQGNYLGSDKARS